eukprot:Gb_04919 [translate_table: standard]
MNNTSNGGQGFGGDSGGLRTKHDLYYGKFVDQRAFLLKARRAFNCSWNINPNWKQELFGGAIWPVLQWRRLRRSFVKRLANSIGSRGRGSGERGAGGAYQGYNNPGSNAGGYEGRMDGNRYGQPPAFSEEWI